MVGKKNVSSVADQTMETANRARQEANRMAQMHVGAAVKLKGQNGVGEILDINGKKATVVFGNPISAHTSASVNLGSSNVKTCRISNARSTARTESFFSVLLTGCLIHTAPLVVPLYGTSFLFSFLNNILFQQNCQWFFNILYYFCRYYNTQNYLCNKRLRNPQLSRKFNKKAYSG